MKDRDVEIRERALAILGVDSICDTAQIKRNFRRQIRLVNPDGPDRLKENVPGFDNTEIARLLIQAYSLLMRRHAPTTMIENDRLVGTLLGGRITPLAETATGEQRHANRFYDQFLDSARVDPETLERELRYKFKGL
ncbi:MAG: hypothetical protein BWZ02_00180 [Lentisphaerae bacterium ADurb.BinA184]|nr:MAG: hypothetical protein BWZ02_00180 [Lentisphaerae bacterium ADurb.BinA184]